MLPLWIHNRCELLGVGALFVAHLEGGGVVLWFAAGCIGYMISRTSNSVEDEDGCVVEISDGHDGDEAPGG